MRKIRDILRLSLEAKLSQRQIARSLRIGLGTVAQYLKRAEQAGLSWPLAQPLYDDEAALERVLFPQREGMPPGGYALADYAYMHEELKRKGVTKYGLWEEYKQIHPHGYEYSQYCHRYRQWLKTQKRSMRQNHKAGEKLFVDYSGATVPVRNADTGEVHPAQIFVAVMGASQYTYAQACWSQTQADWIQAHVNAFNFMGGVPEIVVPDNLKSAVIKADRYDPVLNASYYHMATHYGVAIIPARPAKPKDKSKVENAVLLVQRWILARLRHTTFFSLNELNHAIQALLVSLNQRAFKQRPGSRQSQFDSLDKPALKPLPLIPHVYTEFKLALVPPDYHVAFEGHAYSVPHPWVGHRVEIHATPTGVCFYHKGKQVALHPRSHQAGGTSTHPEHMPKAHRQYQGRSLEELHARLQKIGPHATALTALLNHQGRHPEQAYRTVAGLLKLARQYGDDRFDKACARAIHIGAPTRRSVQSILQKGLDRLPLEQTPSDSPTAAHAHIRGSHYYH